MLLALFLGISNAETHLDFERTEEREDCLDYQPLRQPFFGDTHVHTAFSFDAWGQGTLAGPGDAYRFAKGESIGMQPYAKDGTPSRQIQLRRPLDYAVVTDHSDLMGETRICQDKTLEGYNSLICRVVRRFPKLGYALINGHVYSSLSPERYSFCGANGETCIAAGMKPWIEIQKAAERHYDRTEACQFTSFVGYEWTGMPGGNNIHRNVIFRNQNTQEYPTTYIETPSQEGLWEALHRECISAENGCDVLAIPHNSNVSGGLLFTTTRSDGKPFTEEDLHTRRSLETLVEITQHKGDSECRISAEDELCLYETLTYPKMSDMMGSRADPNDLTQNIYVREVLSEGLSQFNRQGVNPFKFGIIAATDTHLGAPGKVDEDRFDGHAAGTVDARFEVPLFPDRSDFNPGGLGVFWAEENSRDSLFAAMRRREAYGTSGPRMTVRFFGGWDYPLDLCQEPDFVAQGYRQGVPMGGDLPVIKESGKKPRFAVSALRDPGGEGAPSHPLERIQIIKGWTQDGQSKERVFDVAGSATAQNALDLETCTTSAQGQGQLCTVWEDPDFDPLSPAFYYVRVLEVPSCRWNQYACNARNVDCSQNDLTSEESEFCCESEAPKQIRERAWTSPIWYSPTTKDSNQPKSHSGSVAPQDSTAPRNASFAPEATTDQSSEGSIESPPEETGSGIAS